MSKHIFRLSPEAKASKNTALNVKILRSAFAKGLKEGRVKASKTKDKSQLGIALLAEGLSL